MEKILRREVTSIGGNPEWISPTLQFCVDEMGWKDVREIVPVCMLGRDNLLDQSYQKSILETMDPENITDYVRKIAITKYGITL
jgi:hypothetical protein